MFINSLLMLGGVVAGTGVAMWVMQGTSSISYRVIESQLLTFGLFLAILTLVVVVLGWMVTACWKWGFVRRSFFLWSLILVGCSLLGGLLLAFRIISVSDSGTLTLRTPVFSFLLVDFNLAWSEEKRIHQIALDGLCQPHDPEYVAETEKEDRAMMVRHVLENVYSESMVNFCKDGCPCESPSGPLPEGSDPTFNNTMQCKDAVLDAY